MQRAIQTADIFAKAKAWTPDEIIVEDRLKERDAGAFSGLTRSEIDEQFPGYLGNDIWPDDWEPDNDLIERLMVGFERLASLISKSPQRESEDIVAISHGGCIYALESLCGEKYERIPNLAGRWFEITRSDIKLGERVHLLPPEEETFPDHFTI